ncbi:MAG TPA: hypothetical protein VKR58_09340, partial [Aquella sp.]|nr:hypothetical protein [Aquella sp.]
MEHISSLLNISSLDVKREEQKTSNKLDPHVCEVVNYVFMVFFGVCRGFEKYYADIKKLNIEKTQWILQFTSLGFNSLDKVKLGIENTRANS